MDEQEMDVIERPEPIDIDGPEADPRRGQTPRGRADEVWERAEAMRARAAVQAEDVRTAGIATTDASTQWGGWRVPVQTREHLRQSARESVLAITSFVDAVAVRRCYRRPHLRRPTHPAGDCPAPPHRDRARRGKRRTGFAVIERQQATSNGH